MYLVRQADVHHGSKLAVYGMIFKPRRVIYR
jgi:hypothetical protein